MHKVNVTPDWCSAVATGRAKQHIWAADEGKRTLSAADAEHASTLRETSPTLMPALMRGSWLS